jgi:hypothetical protein
MAASIGSSGFASCTGRAVSVRHGDVSVLARRGAAILIAGPGCWPSPDAAIAAITTQRFQVVISAGLNDIMCNNLIKAAVLPVNVPAETISKIQDTVESDPGIAVTVDVDRGEVRARGAVLARFGMGPPAGPLPARPADGADGVSDSRADGGETMARRLLTAQRLLGSASLPGEVRMRLQRSLVAICDAMKAPGADAVRAARRLDRLLTELARNAQHGLAEARDSPVPAQADAARTRDVGQRGGRNPGRRTQ